MIIKNHCLFILIVLLLGFLVQNSSAQDNNHYRLNDLLSPDDLTDDAFAELPDELSVDSIAVKTDSVPSNPNAIDAPISYTAADSMVMVMDGHNMVYLFGDASVKYKNLDLTGGYIEVDADSSIVYATSVLDSIGEEFGYPIFKEGETEYEMRKARYNFRTKKMFITDVITQQGEGYITAGETKKMPNDDLYMRNGHYTTCDDHEHPHFYFQLTKVKVRPKKTIISGPAYLVVEDVPLPIAIPFGFFPFTSDYSSGIIMPTYGDELRRGFSLRDGGYYFAFNDYMDMAVTGEIYTKGSWGLNARSTYRKRYKYSGNIQTGYLITVDGDKGDADYNKSKDFKLLWTHSQDAKANPFGTFSANVNFTTSSFDRNNLTSLYSDRYTQNTKSSSVNYNYRPPNSPFSFSANATVNQISRDSTISMTLPNFTITMRDVYPFQRKEQIGAPKWYENIRMSYTGLFSNSISSVKEYEFFEKNIIRDWKNGMQHRIPVTASFNLFKNITISPSVNYNERWYTSEISRTYDMYAKQVVPMDTTYGFYRVYDYSASVSANTKLYGMFKPWRIFGEWTEKTQIRHVLTPSVSFTGAPDFGAKKYGYYKELVYFNEQVGEIQTMTYSPYSHHQYGVPSMGKSGTMSFSLDNNLEMKIPIAKTDSTRKVSLIDNLRFDMGYNFLADSMNWSDLRSSIRLKFSKSLNLSLQATFDTYTYNENGTRINVTRWEAGKGIGRLRSTGTAFSYSLNNEVIKKLFSRGSKTNSSSGEDNSNLEQIGVSDVDGDLDEAPRTSLRKAKQSDANYDDDGYFILSIPWSLNFNYSMSIGYNNDIRAFNKEKREYPYRVTQTLGMSGNISPTKNWSFNFNTSYDFDYKKFATMQCSVVRQMHCWQMSASIIPIGPYQSYSFSIAVNSSLLKDLKYSQSSSYRDVMNWGE